jgi:hypothetical protein
MLDCRKGIRRHDSLQACPTRSDASTTLPIIPETVTASRPAARPLALVGKAVVRLAVQAPMWYLLD